MVSVEFRTTANLKKFKVDPRQLEGLLSNLAEEAAQQQGCQHCQGRNLTVYVDEVERTEIRGLYYCHDCNQEEPFTAQHNIIDIYESAIQSFQKDLRKMFSG